MKKRYIAGGIAALVAVGVLGYHTHKFYKKFRSNWYGEFGMGNLSTKYYGPSDETPDDKVRIASFNMQVFGRSKAKKKEVVDVLANIVRNFDIVAVQEIKDSSGTALPYLVKKVNQLEDGGYGFLKSRRIGRNNANMEEYAFIYRTNKVDHVDISYVYRDTSDRFAREPFVAGFRTREGNFDFVLVNVHTKPDDAESEIERLVRVVDSADRKFSEDSDIIVIGDLNADGRYFSEEIRTGLRGRRFYWAISDEADTTTGKNDNTYDRVVFQNEFTKEDYTGKARVFRFDRRYWIKDKLVKQVSDHYPVWAEFHVNRDTD